MPKTKKSNTKKSNTKKSNTKKSNTKKENKKGNTRKSRVKSTKLPQKEAVVLIYANWCPHCQSMKPEWEDMKEQLGSNIETIEIEDSDLDKYTQIQNIEDNRLDNENIEISGYPTIFKITNRHADYYKGGRTSNEMIEWVNGSNNGGYNKQKYRIKSKSIKRKSIKR
jgi:thiol-disulfide isomerase/thioredoxin